MSKVSLPNPQAEHANTLLAVLKPTALEWSGLIADAEQCEAPNLSSGFVASLGILEQFLSLAPPRQLLREWLLELFQRFSSVAAGNLSPDEKILLSIRSRNLGRSLQMISNGILDLPCEDVSVILSRHSAHVLRKSLPTEEENTGRRLDREKIRLAQDAPPFRHQGLKYEFPYRQSLLLQYLRDGKRVGESEVISEIYAPKEISRKEGALRKLQADTNTKLLKYKLPFRIVRPVSQCLALKKDSHRGNSR